MGLFQRVCERCRRICKGIRGVYQESPAVFAAVLLILTVITLTTSLFNIFVSGYVGYRGAVVVDLWLFWLFASFVARVLMFPGSLKLFQRNAEATYRAESARQYVLFLRQLWAFLRRATRQSESLVRGVTADGVSRGCAVIETLTASYQMQHEQHEVCLSSEQLDIQALVQDLEHWLRGAQVHVPGAHHGRAMHHSKAAARGPPVPLIDWLRQQATASQVNGLVDNLTSVELAGNLDEASRNIEKIEMLLDTLDDLRQSNKSFIATTLRFFRTPAVGSLNQLRTELQMRYGGQRCWVRSKWRRKVDAMFIPCFGQERAGQDTSPLMAAAARTVVFAGPTIVWCNPNAAYYETMVHQPEWLNFWLSQGCNLFFFNYSGYGASSGSPSPRRIGEDGDAVIDFLKSKGISQIGVYGRSIGGVAACHLARTHPDVVKLLVADRTMSELQKAAKYLYGNWAAQGLHFTRMVHSNVDHFWEVQCYKLLVVDPKDTMILDLAALRTAVALRVISRTAPEERFAIDDEKLARLAEVWQFLQVVFVICEAKENEEGGPAVGRQPVSVRGEKLSEGSGACAAPVGDKVSIPWLQDNAGLVRAFTSPVVEQIRAALDTVGEHLEGGGTTMNDAFLDNPNDPCWALQCMLANMQVWGTLGDHNENYEQPNGSLPANFCGPSVCERDIQVFLRKDFFSHDLLAGSREISPERLRELGQVLAPEMLSMYHRRLARTRVALVHREFRRRLSALQHSFAHAHGSSGGEAHAAEQLLSRTMLFHLGEVDAFVASLGRFFKSVDLASPYARQQGQPELQDAATADDLADERWLDGHAADTSKPSSVAPQPAIDHAAAGFIMHVDCGHNGLLDEVDMRQLALHLRAAGFAEPSTASR